MPIYEYQCGACEHELEALQKLSENPLTDCPGCGKPSLKKKISAAGFRLKGGGWYETDFKTGSKKNLAGGNDGASGGTSDGKAASSPASTSSDSSSGNKSSNDKSSSNKSTSNNS